MWLCRECFVQMLHGTAGLVGALLSSGGCAAKIGADLGHRTLWLRSKVGLS